MKYLLVVGVAASVVLAAAMPPGNATASQAGTRTITVIYTGDTQGAPAPCG